ncbi:MAG: hypothetical protein KBD27_03595 [Candidatus Moranbacteria bacterium]|nr:hypothetical protein [Candidatus Moranbacteria bacterium]
MEQISTPESERKNEKQPLYPERPSEGIEAKIQKLADFEAGRAEKIPLTPEERLEIQKLEEVLGTTLEKIFGITPKEAILYQEYFLTPEGKKDFETVAGVSLEDAGTLEEVERALYQATEKIAQMNPKERGGLIGRSRDYGEAFLFEELTQGKDAEGRISTENIIDPKRVILQLTPSENLKKLQALQSIREYLKKYEKLEVSSPGRDENFKKVLQGTLRLYQSRVNEMLVGVKSDALTLVRKREVVSEEGLSEEEKILLSRVVGTGDAEGALMRYDKFLFGASSQYDADGERRQVGQELAAFADRFEDEYNASVALRQEQIREKGFDPEKLFTKDRGIEEVIKFAEETLEAYGLLSAEPASQYEKDRPGPASDNKWQFVVRDEFKTMAVDGKQKIIKCGTDAQSMANLISVTLAHEIEGHVLQHDNRSKIPLRLFKRIGSGRSSIFAECGAMSNQDVISREAFGYASPPHPHYIRAMQRKLEGGNYRDCLQAFYESSMKGPRLEKSLGRISSEVFEAQSEKNLKLAINRTKRLFGGSTDFSSESGVLSKSKDTVYLEQVKLFEELKKHGLEKYVFVGGANLDALIFLMESGFLEPQDIAEPKQHSLEIWERMKSGYVD